MFQLNGSLFYYIYQNIRLRTTAPPAVPPATLLFKAAKAHIRGVDLDAVVAPLPGLRLKGAAEYLDAQYVNLPGGVCSTTNVIGAAVLGGFSTRPCDLDGHRLPQAPKVSFTLGVDYFFDTEVGRFEFDATDGYNLGIGIPTLVANHVPPGVEVTLQSENGMLGIGPFPYEDEFDPGSPMPASRPCPRCLPQASFRLRTASR